jgi:hypothetical protein
MKQRFQMPVSPKNKRYKRYKRGERERERERERNHTLPYIFVSNIR